MLKINDHVKFIDEENDGEKIVKEIRQKADEWTVTPTTKLVDIGRKDDEHEEGDEWKRNTRLHTFASDRAMARKDHKQM